MPRSLPSRKIWIDMRGAKPTGYHLLVVGYQLSARGWAKANAECLRTARGSRTTNEFFAAAVSRKIEGLVYGTPRMARRWLAAAAHPFTDGGFFHGAEEM